MGAIKGDTRSLDNSSYELLSIFALLRDHRQWT